MRVYTVVGARPQFIKAAPVSLALRGRGHSEYLVHTGQHYDAAMSQVFFDELGIPNPDENLQVGSGAHGEQTGRMLALLEQSMVAQRPDLVLVYGDTNSTLAGALAACKLQIPIAHVEAGLRSFNRSMPEEHNRVLTDHCSSLLFCPTTTAVQNLLREGISRGVHNVGDVMYDAALHFRARARQRSTVHSSLGLREKGYYLATIHRASNTDDVDRLTSLFRALDALDAPVVLPLHPRTRARLAERPRSAGTAGGGQVRIVEPVGYLDMLRLEEGARAVFTDSGGVQKEAYFFRVPCFTLRGETEWVETVEAGWNVLVGDQGLDVAQALQNWRQPAAPVTASPYGDGSAAISIADLIGAPS
jgi:UDP-N-acetylglucosamine 2-epimerase